jgi:pimeloyl-ACP methyl ester carboxylesterase
MGGDKMARYWLCLLLLFTACAGPSTEPPPSKGPVTVPSSDGVEIAATVHSTGQPTVVLVHGWMCDQTYWDNQIPALAEDFGVVTVDLAGHGLSGSDRQTWTINALAQDAAAVIMPLKLTDAIVIGHSMGGRVGLEVARLLPGTVVGVIGVDTLHDADAVWDPGDGAFLDGLENDFATTCGGMVRGMFVESADGALVEQIATDMCSGPGDIGAALIRDYVTFDLASAMQSAGVPVRCINADLWPTNTEANRKYADFDVVILPGVGHFLMQEAPDELNDALIELVTALSE